MQYLNEIFLFVAFILLWKIFSITRNISRSVDTCTNFYLDKIWRYSDACKKFTRKEIFDDSVSKDKWLEYMSAEIAKDLLKERDPDWQDMNPPGKEGKEFYKMQERIKTDIQKYEENILRYDIKK